MKDNATDSKERSILRYAFVYSLILVIYVDYRLYEEGVEKMRQRKNVEENPEKITEEHTFKPKINENPEFSKEANFEKRVLENLKKKQEKLLKIQADDTTKFTFQPQINSKSREIALCKGKNSIEGSFSFKGASREIAKCENNNFTFQPKTLNNPKYQIDGEFIERMEVKNREKQEKIIKIMEEVCSENVTFRPKINRISTLITEEDQMRKRLNSVERLHTNVKEF